MSLKRTPLYDRHVAAGARLVEFGGWSMPVQYQGIVAEHKSARAAAGLFDVSHMGEFRVVGPGATAFCDQAFTNNVATLAAGRCRYSLMCDEQGGILDDLLYYRLADDELLVVVNAANFAADFAWLAGLSPRDCELRDESDRTALLAVQGPASRELLAGLVGGERSRLEALRYYRYEAFTVAGAEALISRTGYTGDLGFEVMLPAAAAPAAWDAILAAGEPAGLVPVGLGARDTLRLEAGFCLHGHDIGPDRNPIEADLARFVDLAKGDFVGREAIAAAAEQGTAQVLVGLAVTGRGIIREQCPIFAGGEPVGTVTSGTFSPLLERSIGMGYVDRRHAAVGSELSVDVRGRMVDCRVAERPFYRPA